MTSAPTIKKNFVERLRKNSRPINVEIVYPYFNNFPTERPHLIAACAIPSVTSAFK